MNSTAALLSVEGLSIGFSGAPPILPPISFRLQSGQVTSIVGHNGAGKSTLLKTLIGLAPQLGGQVRYLPGTRIGYVPQREAMDPIYPIGAQELIETGRYGLRGVGRVLNDEDHRRIDEAIAMTGVQHLRKRLFRVLSGGEQQRVLLARALCTEPNVLVLDEPTASLDEKGAMAVMDLTLDLAKKQGASILMVNHFLDLVAKVSDQVVFLDRDHQMARVGTPAEILQGRVRL